MAQLYTFKKRQERQHAYQKKFKGDKLGTFIESVRVRGHSLIHKPCGQIFRHF